jgi:hypothetical protein
VYSPTKYGGASYCSQDCYRNPLRQKSRTYQYIDPTLETKFYNPKSPYVSFYNRKSPFASYYNPKSPYAYHYSPLSPWARKWRERFNAGTHDIEQVLKDIMSHIPCLPHERDDVRQELAVALLIGAIPLMPERSEAEAYRREARRLAMNWFKHRSLEQPIGDNYTLGRALGITG